MEELSRRKKGFIMYWLLVIVTLALGMFATASVNHQLSTYSNVYCSLGMTGEQAARAMLTANGITNVAVKVGAEGQDHFDPRDNTISLSPSAYRGNSVTAVATACHEAGHACQYAEGYTPLRIRSSIVPVANLASNAWIIILIAGILVQSLYPYVGSWLILIAIAVYALVVVFHLVTLPVEFNASARGLAYLDSRGMAQDELAGAQKVLRACAFTYVAAALASLLQLLYLLGQTRR